MEASTLTTAAHSGLLGRRSPLLRLQGDERLVALIRDGHDRAFEVLFDRYQARLLAFCRHLLNSHQDAEDVLQEVFVAAHAAMLADERPIKARPWLYRIARNRCLNHLRRQVPEGQDSMDIHPLENGTTTLEHVQTREQLREIVSDMHQLPETQRTAMVLREIDDLSYTEIAQAMGTTLPAVKSLLVRARMALAEASEARLLTCDDVRLELAEAAEGLCKASGPIRRHVRDCPSCRRYRRQLRSSSRAVAGLAPIGLLSLFQKLIGVKLGGGAAGGGAAGTAAAGGGATAAGGSSGALGGAIAAGGAAGGTLGAKAAVGMATAALFTAGAVGVNKMEGNEGQGASSVPTAKSHPATASRPLHRVTAPTHPTGDELVATRGHASPSPSAKASKVSAEQTGGTPATTAEDAPPDGGQAAPETTDTGQAPPPVTGAGSSGSGSSASGSSTGGDTGEDPAPPPPDPTAPAPPDPSPAPDPTPTPNPTPPPPDQPPPAPSPPAG
jgi:RNA polymerase sigma factor (sigma-70 family)